MRLIIWAIGFIATSCAAVVPSSELDVKQSLESRGFDQDGRFTFDRGSYKIENTITFANGVESWRQRWFIAGLEDAITLARHALNMPTDHIAFINYFYEKDEHPKIASFDTNYATFQRMMAVIADPRRYQFVIEVDPSNPNSWATTDSYPPAEGARVSPFYTYMKLRPSFFAQQYDPVTGIYSNDPSCYQAVRLLNQIPVDPRRNDPITYYEGRGHIILHELTHLHQVAELAGLPVDDPTDRLRRRGTRDWKSSGGGNDSRDARYLKNDLDTLQTAADIEPQGLMDPIRNAESYAAAATEYWFRVNYGLSRVPTS